MRMSEVKGRQVVTLDSADTVGKVSELILDPGKARVAAVRLTKTPDNGDVLLWQDISGFGEDAVTVKAAERIVVADSTVSELADKRHAILGKRVLTDAGVDIGIVEDVEFDPASGEITTVLLTNAEVPGQQLAAVGSYAVIVRA